MNSEDYLRSLLDSQVLSEQELTVLRELRQHIELLISPLDGNPRFRYGGSYGKKTIIRERYDLDLVAYWPRSTNYTIKQIYDGVGEQLKKAFEEVNSKTVAWTIPFDGNFHVDVVPGRAIDDNFFETNLYRTDTETTLKTSLKTHIDVVKDSGRRDVVRLMKLWRERRNVPFKKSFLLELLVIEGCKDLSYTDLEIQMLGSLKYLVDVIETKNVLDPANSNNSLSDDISSNDKRQIKILAQAALAAPSWFVVFASA